MRKLKLQMHITLDGFSNMEGGGKKFKWDHKVIRFCVDNLKDVDALLLGRKTADELIPFWDTVALNKKHPDYALGKRISELPKFVFSNTAKENKWQNATLIKGDLEKEVKKLKRLRGNNLLAYGGVSFASALIENRLVDAFYFLKNPFCLGKGLSIFKREKNVPAFTLEKSKPFPCGTIMLSYTPKK
ncbi:MAG: dihydrofolate reductase family protein [Ferruginibacter sp.]